MTDAHFEIMKKNMQPNYIDGSDFVIGLSTFFGLRELVMYLKRLITAAIGFYLLRLMGVSAMFTDSKYIHVKQCDVS